MVFPCVDCLTMPMCVSRVTTIIDKLSEFLDIELQTYLTGIYPIQAVVIKYLEVRCCLLEEYEIQKRKTLEISEYYKINENELSLLSNNLVEKMNKLNKRVIKARYMGGNNENR